MEELKVVELFAGVGGFRLGLETASSKFKTIWANQWEPSTVEQDAYQCYVTHWGEKANCVCKDIALVRDSIPQHDLLVGGFPCQDYSIANKAGKGIEGKKGELWWQINYIIKSKLPKYVLLENVDRLLWSPRKQFGRDFSLILRCFYEAGYTVEWRVINAAEYGFAQRRKRVFIFAYRNDTPFSSHLTEFYLSRKIKGLHAWIMEDGFFAGCFPLASFTHNYVVNYIDHSHYPDIKDLYDHHKEFYKNSGVMLNGRYYSVETIPEKQQPITLRQLIYNADLDEHYFIKDADMPQWIYAKGPKDEMRKGRFGKPFHFKEGRVDFPDSLDRPGRTIMTKEAQLSRCSHAIEDPKTGHLRVLIPEECELMNGFPAGWTNTGMGEDRRYFMMGNALVVPLITAMGLRLLEIL